VEEPTTIVLADDDGDVHALLSIWLREDGHSVWEARDAEEAIELVRRNRPALLLLDLWGPGVDGFRVLDALRHDPSSDRLVSLLLANELEADTHLEALAAGAAGCLGKGGTPNELRARLSPWLQPTRPFFLDFDDPDDEITSRS
jgi:CheY-like chemotaxis protein